MFTYMDTNLHGSRYSTCVKDQNGITGHPKQDNNLYHNGRFERQGRY